ncbi:energy-coupling factor ABC transporter ATP-binding protein [Desulfurococcus mucosus]|uniref:ABC transporter related protein n=1 Tax=Desulfurococcus mucosus (strain ATCC 35584 / DSM 2162 / JCM 9187 / O7/1) TaxID=765177 RepID=E8R9S2_DESM0|nr:ABC transporter ATP-binding protein [Desulfurococcus mucosus]ADV65248.1 ABC transporter related protein [Desulfurococcus mucosus DSM 2162]
MNTIKVVDLSIGYPGGKPLVENIGFTLEPGLHVLVGANGSGKSTLLKTMAGILKPLKGKVEINGVNIHRVPRRDAARLVGYVWQNPFHGFIEASVEREIAFISKTTGARQHGEIVYRLVDPELMDRSPFSLSGGEARRVAIASVLSIDQPVWFLDEPFSDLDYKGYRVLADLVEYGVKKGKIIVVTTHIVSLLDSLKPKGFLLIDRGRRRLLMGEWSELTDEVLLEAGVIPRGVSCGSTL